MTTPCDILVPAAIGGVLTEEVARRVSASLRNEEIALLLHVCCSQTHQDCTLACEPDSKSARQVVFPFPWHACRGHGS